MPRIPVVENPRRRRHRRRKMSALQAKYFGKGHGRHRRRRRNPALATLAANPRRRRHRGGVARYHRRRYRNPSIGGMFGGIQSAVMDGLWIGAGILSARIGPKLISKVWAGAPTTGLGLYAVQAGGTVAISMGVRLLLKNSAAAQKILVGGFGYILFELANEYILPQVGLAGLADDQTYVTTGDLERLGINGYEINSNTISGYQSITESDAMAL